MYPVSKAFQEAIRKPQRITSVRGALHLKDVSGQKSFDESAIVQKSLQITDQLNSGKFGYGSVYSRNMSVKLDYTKIDGVEGVNINLTNATIVLWFKLTLADGTEEEILLGNFLIDSAKSSRKFNILSIYANDYLPKLGVPSVPVSNLTPYQIFTEACGLSKQGTGNKEDFVNALPNGDKTFTFDTSQIQTAWDMVMWVSQITGTFVRAKRQDEPCPQLVQIPTKYTKGGTSENFDLETFKADNGSIIPADVRFSTDFTDTSIRNTTLLMNVKGKMFKSHRNWTFAPDTLEGTLELKSNPLLEGKTEGEIQAIIDNIQDYTDDLRFCPFKTTFNGNPAIEVGDFVYLEPGGAVDETKYRHYGIVTYSKWVYRGKCEIRCAADMTAERPSTTAAASAKSANGMMRAAPKAASDVFGVQPKSQLEKKIDALSGAGDASALVFKPWPNVRLEFKSPTDLHMMNGDKEIFNIFGDTSTDNTRFLNLNVIKTANVVINNHNLEIKWANGARLLLYANNGNVFFEGSETIPGTNRKYNWEINTYEGEIRINGKKVTL